MKKEAIGIRPGGAPVAVKVGSLVFLSGLDPMTPEAPGGIAAPGDIAEQTEFVIGKLKRTIAPMGCTLADVVKVTAFIDDMADWATFNAAYNEHFPDDATRPARTTLQAGGFYKGMCVELDVVVLAPDDSAMGKHTEP